MPSSVLQLRLQSTDRVVADKATVSFAGVHSVHGKFIETYSAEVDRLGDVGDIVVRLPVSQSLWDDVDTPSPSSFEGNVEVELSDALGPVVRGRLDSVQFEFVRQLEPFAEAFSVGDVYPNQLIEISGAGFLRPEEGATVAVIESGSVDTDAGPSRDVSGQEIALRWAGSRDKALVPVDPAVFGVQTASFEVSVYLENQLTDGSTSGRTQTVELSGTIQQPYIARLSPDAGSRGQKITIVGRGLIPTDDEGGYGMLLRYEGTFTPDDPELPSQEFNTTPLRRPPDRIVNEQEAEQSVWYTIEDDRSLTGLGATPGVFEGTITPELFDNWGDQEGIAWQGVFRVLPTKQVVYLKYLPAFSKGLEKYGLRNVEREIRDRVLEVAERDYEGINIDFREAQPDDFIEYAVIELGGPDPSGRNAFGYDNTFNGVAKDTGNLFLGDYLGGVNAQSGEEFNNPYGGIFIESFSFFSPTLNPDSQYTSPAFDRIMKPFMPALDGEPIKGSEWPDGPRREAIADAIHMVGSVIGNTVSHELGHSFGLTYFPEDDIEPTNRFHNQVSGPYIMDPGAERPFEERAELDGQGPARFNDRNYNYLRTHLPAPE
ncbi:hypothetical protein FIV42_27515 [Persicimonas caeni]|uniref:Uncharacterized protein n=1 Tax=Persicimonas caeni TaxID=2292766 RepID=A0A4Y6Q1M0_PERCE|nr:hypothetical protein [Persicimonas caeni]QDG54359.1 hypothetical protein FIV42_27515 [Persicimonas caeni]